MDTFAVRTTFDTPRIIKRLAESKPATIGIYIQVGKRSFPNVTWDDFACVLEWWLRAIWNLSPHPGGKCKLLFMDGPYEVSIHYLADGVCSVKMIEAGVKRRTVSVSKCLYKDICSEIEKAGDELCRTLAALGASDRDFQALKSSLTDYRISSKK